MSDTIHPTLVVDVQEHRNAAYENGWGDGYAEGRSKAINEFSQAILHGDDEHRAWLKEVAEAFIAGKPLPAPRGKGTQPEA